MIQSLTRLRHLTSGFTLSLALAQIPAAFATPFGNVKTWRTSSSNWYNANCLGTQRSLHCRDNRAYTSVSNYALTQNQYAPVVKLALNSYMKVYAQRDRDYTPEDRRRLAHATQVTIHRFGQLLSEARADKPLSETEIGKVVGGLVNDFGNAAAGAVTDGKVGLGNTAQATYSLIVNEIGDALSYSARGQFQAKGQIYQLEKQVSGLGDVMSDFHAFAAQRPGQMDELDAVIADYTKVQVSESADEIIGNDLLLRNLTQSEEGFALMSHMLQVSLKEQAVTKQTAQDIQKSLIQMMEEISKPKKPTEAEVRAAKVDDYLAVVQIYGDLGSLIPDPEVRNFVAKTSLVAGTFGKIQRAIINPDGLSKHLLTANVVGAVVSLFQGLLGGGPSTDEIILEEIAKIQESVRNLHENMNQQFKHLNQKIDIMYEQMNAGFNAVLSAQGVNRIELLRIQGQLTSLTTDIEELSDLSIAGTTAILAEIRLSDVSFCLKSSKFFESEMNEAADIAKCLVRLSDFATSTARESVLSGIGREEAELLAADASLVNRRSAYNLFAAPNTVSEVGALDIAKMALWSPVSRLNNLAAIAKVSYGYDIFTSNNSSGKVGVVLFPHPEHWLHNTGAALNLVDQYRDMLSNSKTMPNAAYYDTLYRSGESIQAAVHALRQRPLLETIVTRNTSVQVETLLLMKALEYQFLACNGTFAAADCVSMGTALLGIFQEEISKIKEPLTAAHYDQILDAIDARLTNAKDPLIGVGLLEHRRQFWTQNPETSATKIPLPTIALPQDMKQTVGELKVGATDAFFTPLTRAYVQLGLTVQKPNDWKFTYAYQSVGNNITSKLQKWWNINHIKTKTLIQFPSGTTMYKGDAFSTLESSFGFSEENFLSCKKITPLKVGSFVLSYSGHRSGGLGGINTYKFEHTIDSSSSKLLKQGPSPGTFQFELKGIDEAFVNEDYSNLECVDQLNPEIARAKINEKMVALRSDLQQRLENSFLGTAAADVYFPIVQVIHERSKQLAAMNVYALQLLTLATVARPSEQNQLTTMLITGRVLPTTENIGERLKSDTPLYTAKTFESVEAMNTEIREKVIPMLTAIPRDQTIEPIDQALRELETLRR